MTAKVYVGGRAIALSPALAIGKGGEADVFALPDGRALKVFKGPKHPDVRDSPAERDAAKARIDEHQRKLREFPAGLPERVVGPDELATTRGGRRVLGYAMRRIDPAEPLLRYAEPRVRRKRITGAQAVGVLRDLHATVQAIHAAGAVIGDFNDLNVLVSRGRAHVIDADSFQFGRYRCGVFTERFVDPLLCDPNAPSPELVLPHTAESDWYAFSVIAMRSLVCCGPYGGVHKPADASTRVGPGRRALARVTVFDPDVRYPKPAIHYSALPDELLHYLHRVFARDERGPMPAALLDRLRWTTCTSCGAGHARPVCPACIGGATRAAAPAVRVRGTVTSTALPMTPELAAFWCDGMERNGSEPVVSVDGRRYWLGGTDLVRDGRLGPERIGAVLPNTTRFWVGDEFGIGFYAAGQVQVGFTFDATRRGLNDQVELPPLTGTVVDCHAVTSATHAWVFVTEQRGKSTVAHCTVVARDGAVAASADIDDDWIQCARTACAVGAALFAATDAGIVRVEVDGGAIAVTRVFADTEPFVDASCRLRVARGGLAAVFPERAALLTL